MGIPSMKEGRQRKAVYKSSKSSRHDRSAPRLGEAPLVIDCVDLPLKQCGKIEAG